MTENLTREVAGFTTFELDLPRTLAQQISETMSSMEPASLLTADLNAIPNSKKGVYFLEDYSDQRKNRKVVYVGKADGKEGLQQRLKSHQKRIQMRENLDATQIYFKAIHIYVFQPRDVEDHLIVSFQSSDTAEWNKNGFGTNDPGKNRDQTELKDNHYDRIHSIDLNASMPFQILSGKSVIDTVKEWAEVCPWTFRNISQLSTAPNWKRNVNCSTPDEFLSELEEHLEPGSRIIAHPGRLYVPEHDREVNVFKRIYGSLR